MSINEYRKSAIDICTNYFVNRMYKLKEAITYVNNNFNPMLPFQEIRCISTIEHHCDLEMLENALSQDDKFNNHFIDITYDCVLNYEVNTITYSTTLIFRFAKKDLFLKQ